MSDEENEGGSEEGNIEIYLRIKPIANPSKKVEYDLTEGKARGNTAATCFRLLARCGRCGAALGAHVAREHRQLRRALHAAACKRGCLRPAASLSRARVDRAAPLAALAAG
jgi:hypothetical protein